MIYTLVLTAALTGAIAVEPEVEVETITDRVERIARDYRLNVYDAYHSDRERFDARYKLSSRIHNAWIEAGRPDDFAERLITWYEASSQASTRPTVPSWISELEAGAANNTAVSNEPAQTAKPFKLSPPITDVAPVDIRVVAPSVNVAVEQPQPAPTIDGPATNIIDSLGRSLLRATINSTDENEAGRFD